MNGEQCQGQGKACQGHNKPRPRHDMPTQGNILGMAWQHHELHMVRAGFVHGRPIQKVGSRPGPL
ncbi:hypothetical protein GBA52_015000 [Prunus armeniaca]|nr:hypothetical protein GBA52_015000 [Prunus armeniaca]